MVYYSLSKNKKKVNKSVDQEFMDPGCTLLEGSLYTKVDKFFLNFEKFLQGI